MLWRAEMNEENFYDIFEFEKAMGDIKREFGDIKCEIANLTDDISTICNAILRMR